MVTLAHLASVTQRVKLGLGVIILPQRQPVLLAKQLTTVDVLSGGRLLVGLGVGYLEAELAALGSTMAERGARMDESIAAMRMLWDEAAPQFEGRFVSFANVFQRPLPAQRPHPPLVIGGESPAAFRRARAAGAWYGWEHEPEQIAERARALGDEVEITLTPGPPGPLDPARAQAFAEAGVSRLVLQPPDTIDRGDGRADRRDARDVDQPGLTMPRAAQATAGRASGSSSRQRSRSRSRVPSSRLVAYAPGGADAERERLPPLLEARGPERRLVLGDGDVSQAGLAQQLARARLRARRRRSDSSRDVGIELARRAPEGRERAALARVVPDAGRDDAAAGGSRAPSRAARPRDRP